MNFYDDPDFRTAVKYVEFGSVTQPVRTSNWFKNTTNLRHINWRNFDPIKLTSAYAMFQGSGIKYVDLGNQHWPMCVSMSWMFYVSKVRYVRMPVTSDKLAEIAFLFCRCAELSDVDVSLLDTSGVSVFSHVFGGQFAGDTVIATTLDLRNWDTSSATGMAGMFANCRQLEQILGLEDFDVSHVRDFEYMFYSCKKLDVRDQVAQWNPETPANCSGVFYNTSNVSSEFEYPPFILLDNLLGKLPPVKTVYLNKVRPADSISGVSFYASSNTNDIELSRNILETFTVQPETTGSGTLKMEAATPVKLHTASHPDKSNYLETNLAFTPNSKIRIMSKSELGYEDLDLFQVDQGMTSAAHLYIPQDDSEYGDGYLWPSMRG